jgi:hypothetical protein
MSGSEIKSSAYSLWKEFETDPTFLSQATYNFDRKVSVSHDILRYDSTADYKVLVYCGEPNAVWDIDSEVISMHKEFDLILTWKQVVLDNCPNAEKFLFGGKTINDNKLILYKKNQISYLTSNKNFTSGHTFRQNIWEFFNTNDFEGDYQFLLHKSPPRIDKELIFNNAKFSIIVENTNQHNYFSEKLIDCISTRTIPIYCGCPNISEYFDMNGILVFNTIEELVDIITNLSSDYYEQYIDVMEKNYQTSKQYWDYYGRIGNKIKEKLNDLI